MQTMDSIPKEMNSLNSRDRTNEFQTTVKILAAKPNVFDRPLQTPIKHDRNRSSAIEQRSVFMQNTKRIGEDLSQTLLKLERLILLNKQSSLFNDNSIEIQNLIVGIKEDIKHLNQQIEQLQPMSDTKNSKLKDSQIHYNSIALALQSKVSTISNDLKQILEARIQSLKKQKLRRDTFSKSTVVSNSKTKSILTHDDTAIDMDSNQTSHSLGNQQLQILDESDAYYASRSEAMQHIEHTIVELGETFNQLAVIIQQQQESIERTNQNIIDATVHFDKGHHELLKYLRTITSNGWLMTKVFAILIIFFLIFIIFFV